MRILGIFVLCVAISGLGACATSPLGRHQFKLYSDQQIAQMGALAFQQTVKETPVSNNAVLTRFVQCVASAITAQTHYPANWDVRVFQSNEINAFALPGGGIGVYTGLLKVTQNQDQLAAVIGHEVSHVIAGHANERVSSQSLTEAGVQLVGASGMVNPGTLALLGMGAQVGILLPFSRTQESEADLLGLDLMARAGFDPRQAVNLWRNMQSAGGGQPPELLSSHPSDATRIAQLQARVPQDLPVYQQVVASGRAPQCGAVPH